MILGRIPAACLVAACVTTLLGVLATALSTGADADEYHITFRIKSTYEYRIQVAFYAQNRDWSWPGPGRAYDIDNSRLHEFKLQCHPGERICYGGWVEGNGRHYWGVGLRNRQRCEHCCYNCEDNVTRVIDLE